MIAIRDAPETGFFDRGRRGVSKVEQSRRGCAGEYAVDLGGHDEVVLM
jgi:hypothetical protein